MYGERLSYKTSNRHNLQAVDPPSAALLIHATFDGFREIKSVLGLVASWLMDKIDPKGDQNKEPYGSCNMRDEPIVSFKRDLDLDSAKLVNKLEQRSGIGLQSIRDGCQ